MNSQNGVHNLGLGRSFEQVFLQNSKIYFKPPASFRAGESSDMNNYKKTDISPHGVQYPNHPNTNTSSSNGLTNKFWWWSPPENSLPVEFCQSTSMHGLYFVAKPKVHMSERIFWAIAFILGVVAAVYLINDVWQRYYKNPVIVSFQDVEVDIDSIPFPAVTLCNMNAFPRTNVKNLEQQSLGSGPEALAAKEALKYVRSICSAQQSFAKAFDFAHHRGVNEDIEWNDTISEDSQDDMIDFLLEQTISCSSLIRLCMLGERKVDCGEYFKPIITDFGKCCTFNILPLPLLLRNPQSLSRKRNQPASAAESELNPALGKKRRWNRTELDSWGTWDFEQGFVLPNKSATVPFRQKRAGMPYGLSILIDPNLSDWYCPVSDAQGFRFLLGNPLEMPHIDEFASVIHMDKEILIEIHPEMTNADDDIRDFSHEIRQCYFPKERQLQFFGPYTGGNCIDECTALILEKRCNCTHFYMPRNDNVSICNTDPDSKDSTCISNAKVDLQETLKSVCGHCDGLCEDIQYNFETTMSTLQSPLKLWSDPDPGKNGSRGPPEWANNSMSILHIFFGSETTVPKLRKRLYGSTDLIANTGGLLGLCLGFSVLSAVEVVYFLTLRLFWQLCWKRIIARKHAKKFITSLQSKKRRSRRKDRVITLNSNEIPVFQAPHNPSWNFPAKYNTVGNHQDFARSILLDGRKYK